MQSSKEADPSLPDAPEALRQHMAFDTFVAGDPLSVIPHLQNGEPLTPKDFLDLWNLIRAKIPETEENAGIYRHLADTAAYAARIFALSPNGTVSPTDAAVMALFRNLGMLLGSCEYFDKSIVSTVTAERLGVHERLRALLLPLAAYTTPQEVFEDTTRNKLVEVNINRTVAS